MKYLYTVSLCLIFTFLGSFNITNAQTCGNISCPSPKVCVSVDGATKCLDNQANSSGICPGDSNIKCSSNQACVSNQAREIVCAAKVTANSLTPAPTKSQPNSTEVNSTNRSNTVNSSTEESGNITAGTNPQGLKEGLNAFKGEDSGLNTTGTLIAYVANIIRWILGILGTVFFVIIVIQGYLYMTAGGNSSQTAAATGAITNAVVGLLIIMGAFLITNFVTSGLLASG